MGFLCQLKIHCIAEYRYRDFIQSEVPEEVLLSVLADPEGSCGEEIIHLILERLVQLRGNSAELLKFIQQLKILSILRKLGDETIKQVNQMSLIIPKELIEADGLFIQGREKELRKALRKALRRH